MKYVSLFFSTVLVVLVSGIFSFASLYVDKLLGLLDYHSHLSLVSGVAIVILGLLFRTMGSLQFHRYNVNILTLRAQHTLITDGLFSYSRNPLYIGIVLIFLGCVLIVGTISGLIMVMILFFIFNYWVRNREEKYMGEAFGTKYQEYKRKVPRWI